MNHFKANQHDSFGFNDDDFLSDDAALKQLWEDEVAFENSNMFLLGDNDVNSEVASMIGNNDTKDISQFFNHGNNELGLEGTSSPEKAWLLIMTHTMPLQLLLYLEI